MTDQLSCVVTSSSATRILFCCAMFLSGCELGYPISRHQNGLERVRFSLLESLRSTTMRVRLCGFGPQELRPLSDLRRCAQTGSNLYTIAALPMFGRIFYPVSSCNVYFLPAQRSV